MRFWFSVRARRPSPALVISVIALIVAVGGGTFAFAALTTKKVKKIATNDANNVFSSRIGSASVANASNAGNATVPVRGASIPADQDRSVGGGQRAGCLPRRAILQRFVADVRKFWNPIGSASR